MKTANNSASSAAKTYLSIKAHCTLLRCRRLLLMGLLLVTASCATQPSTPSFQIYDSDVSRSMQANAEKYGLKSVNMLKNGEYTALVDYIDKKIMLTFADISEEQSLRWELDYISETLEILDTQVDQLVEQHPDHYASYLIRGLYNYGRAYRARGSAFSSRTSDAQIKGLKEFLALVYPDIDKGVALNARIPQLEMLRIRSLRWEPGNDALIDQSVEKVFALLPESASLWDMLMSEAQPRWGGSMDEMTTVLASARQFYAANPALKHLETAIEREIGDHYYFADEYINAELHYLRALELGDNLTVRLNLGWIARHKGNIAQACRQAEAAIALYPYDRNANWGLLWCEKRRDLN